MVESGSEAKKVLIVDDDPINIGFLGPILSGAGYTVLAVQAAEKVLPLVRSKHPDIILLDISMPVMDGYELCRRIHAEPGSERTPVIFITGWSGADDVARGFEAGGVDYLLKPVNRTELLARMRNHLERRHYEASLSLEKDRFRILTESVGEAFILLDPDFMRIQYVNPSFGRIFGFMPEILPTSIRIFRKVLEREQVKGLVAVMKEEMGSERSFNHELHITRPDGSGRWVWIRTSRIPQTSGYVVVVEDITERKAAELQLRENLEEEARVAGTIQQTLLMKGEEVDAEGVESVFVSIPSRTIDGDFYDVFSHPDGFDVIIGDVMGKGLGAALVGVGAKAAFLRALAKLGSACMDRPLPDLDAIVGRVNRAIAGKLMQLESFITLQYLRFMRSAGYLEYVDCGHMPLMVWDGAHCWILKGSNLPIGFLRDQRFESYRVPLRPGSTVLAYSDGITEAKSPSGEFYGEARLCAVIRASGRKGPEAIVDAIRADLDACLEGQASADDVTLAVFGIGMEPVLEPARHDATFDFGADPGHLGEVRKAVAALLGAYGPGEIAEERRDLVVLAASEAASNVIIHGLGSDPSRRFSLRLEAWESWYSLCFRYEGEDFDWARSHTPSVEAFDEGGYGIHIMKNAMSSYTVARSDSGLIEVVLSGVIS